MMRGRIRLITLRTVPPLAVLVALLVTWEMGVFHDLFDLKIFTVPYPTAVVEAFFEGWWFFRKNAYDTFYAAGVGYVLGSIAGVSLAILLSEVDPLRRYLLPVTSGFAAMPILATAPLMVLYFGLGPNSAIAVVVLMSVPPTVISVYKGLTSIERESQELLESLAVGRLGGLTKLKIPSALPWIFTSLKLNVTLALVGVIVTEFVTVQRGLGTLLTRSLETFDTPDAYASMLIVAILGVVWFQAVQIIETVSIPWHSSVRSDGG
ncbi:MAG: ABC transporter permease [bacterium]|nr:ABC transporter permease [bacterium]